MGVSRKYQVKPPLRLFPHYAKTAYSEVEILVCPIGTGSKHCTFLLVLIIDCRVEDKKRAFWVTFNLQRSEKCKVTNIVRLVKLYEK